MWTPALPVRPTCPGRAAAHWHPLPHVDGAPARRVLCGDPTPPGPSAALVLGGWASLVPGIQEVSHVLRASLAACQALQTPTAPPASRPPAAGARAAGACTPSPPAGESRWLPTRPPHRPGRAPCTHPVPHAELLLPSCSPLAFCDQGLCALCLSLVSGQRRLCPTAPALPWVPWAAVPHLPWYSAPRRLPPWPSRVAALGARFPIPCVLPWFVVSLTGS